MKSKFRNIILFITLIALIATIAIFGMSIYLNITNKDVGASKVIHILDSIKATITEYETTMNTNKITVTNEIPVNEIQADTITEGKYYYKQLTNTQKKIYDGLYKNKKNMRNGTYKISYGDIFTDILKKENGSEKLGQDYQAAVECFLYDNPDVFYIDANKLYINIETSSSLFKTTYDVYIGPKENANYYSKGFTSETQVKIAINKIESIKNNITSKLTGNKYKDILQIHDYLVNSIDYDSNYESIGSYSIYGALIDKKCVCEGYAKTLKYLLNESNIPCEIVQGTATNDSGKSESHAWNVVLLENKWYYIDVTWDDPIIKGQGTFSKSVHYRYFLKGSNTIDKNHTLSYQFSENGKTYKYPTVEKYDYK